MTTVQELAVAVRAEGIDETQQEMDDLEGNFEETSDSVGDSASEMEGFAQEFQGAMTAVLAGLAIAAAGLATQVPIVGGLFAGLASILDAVAFQIDQVLRPVLQPIIDGLFDLSAAIFEAEGPLGDLIGIVGAAALVLGGLAGAGLAVKGAWMGLGPIIKAAGGALAGLSATALAVGAVIAIAVGAWITDFANFRTRTLGLLGEVQDTLSTWAGWLRGALGLLGLEWLTHSQTISGALNTVFGLIEQFSTVISQSMIAPIRAMLAVLRGDFGTASTIIQDWLENIGQLFVETPIKWGQNLIDGIISGIRDSMPDLSGVMDDVTSEVKDWWPFSDANKGPLSDWTKAGPSLIDTAAEGIEASTPRVGNAMRQATEEVGGGDSRGHAANRAIKNVVQVDGRTVDEQTRHYRDAGTSRRGRNG